MQYGWVYNPKSKPGVKPSESLKIQVNELAEKLIADWKKTYIKADPTKQKHNYLVDIYSKWRGNHFTIGGTYKCPSKTAMFPSFESGFAKLEYVGNDKFNLAFMRHTEKWWKTELALTVKECFDLIRQNEMYHPI